MSALSIFLEVIRIKEILIRNKGNKIFIPGDLDFSFDFDVI